MKTLALASALVCGMLAGNMAFATGAASAPADKKAAGSAVEAKATTDHKAVPPKKGTKAAAPATATGTTGSTGTDQQGHTGH